MILGDPCNYGCDQCLVVAPRLHESPACGVVADPLAPAHDP